MFQTGFRKIVQDTDSIQIGLQLSAAQCRKKESNKNNNRNKLSIVAKLFKNKEEINRCSLVIS